MNAFNKITRDFELIRQLEQRAADCKQQADLLKRKWETTLNGGVEPKEKNTTLSNFATRYKNGVSMKLLALMKKNPDKIWRTPEIIKVLKVTQGHAHEILRRAIKNGMAERVHVGEYKLSNKETK